ncbi:MAG: hypothetical protein ABEI31_00325 [Halodesulfurarchaeum sp.]
MHRRTLGILLVVAAVLGPMWFVALHGEAPTEEVAIDQTVTDMRPLQEVIDTPNKLSPSQVGVIVWVALFALLGLIAFAHRFMVRAVRPAARGRAIADGGGPAWLETEHRWIARFVEAPATSEGLVVMGGFTVLSIIFAALFIGEYLTLARTQYFGIYAAGMFLSLAALTVAYYAWFIPHTEVAEERQHGT